MQQALPPQGPGGPGGTMPPPRPWEDALKRAGNKDLCASVACRWGPVLYFPGSVSLLNSRIIREGKVLGGKTW